MSQYLLSVHMVEGAPEPSADHIQRLYRQVDELNDEIRESGAWVFAGGLHPASAATVVREQDGDILVTDGPFPEAKEQLGGFWVIEVADRETAHEWAGRGALAAGYPVEVRPLSGQE